MLDNLRHKIRPSENSSLLKIMVPANTSLASESHLAYNITQHTPTEGILWETLVKQEEIERHLLHYNRDSFRAVSESPCGHGIIHDALTFSSLSEDSEALLAGIVPDKTAATITTNENSCLHLLFRLKPTHRREILTRKSQQIFSEPQAQIQQGDIDTGISADFSPRIQRLEGKHISLTIRAPSRAL